MWVVKVFSKETERLVRDVRITADLPLAELRPLWRVPKDDPMYDSYPVREAEGAALSRWVDIAYEFKAFSYFLEQQELEPLATISSCPVRALARPLSQKPLRVSRA